MGIERGLLFSFYANSMLIKLSWVISNIFHYCLFSPFSLRYYNMPLLLILTFWHSYSIAILISLLTTPQPSQAPNIHSLYPLVTAHCNPTFTFFSQQRHLIVVLNQELLFRHLLHICPFQHNFCPMNVMSQNVLLNYNSLYQF